MAIRQAAMRAVFMLLVAAVQAGAVAAPRGLAKPPDITQSVRRVVRRLGRKMGVLIKSRRATRGAAGQNASNGWEYCCKITGDGEKRWVEKIKETTPVCPTDYEFDCDREKILCLYSEVWEETKVCPRFRGFEFKGFTDSPKTAEDCGCAKEDRCTSCPTSCGKNCHTMCYRDQNSNESEPKPLRETRIRKWGSANVVPSTIAFVQFTEPYVHLKVMGGLLDDLPNGAEIVDITTQDGHNPEPPCEEDLSNQAKKNVTAAVTFLLPELPNAAPRVKSDNPVCCACWGGGRDMVVGPATIAEGLNECQCNGGKHFNVPLSGRCSLDVVHWITWSSLVTESTAITNCDKDKKHSWVNILTVQALLMTGQPLTRMMGQNYVIEADEVTQWVFFYNVVKGLAGKVVDKLGDEKSCLCKVDFPTPFPGQKRRYVIGNKPDIRSLDTLWNAAKVSITEYKNKDQLLEDYKTDIEGWAKQFKCKP